VKSTAATTETGERLPRSLRALIIAAGVVIVVAGMRAAAPVLAPFALAVFVAIISLPVLNWLRHRGAPVPIAILATVLIDATVLVGAGAIILQAAGELGVVAPAYLVRLQALEAAAVARLETWGYEVSASPVRDLVSAERLFVVVTGAARRLTGVAGITLLLVLYVAFMLAESVGLPLKLKRAFGDRADHLSYLSRVVSDVQRYLAFKTLVSLATGILIGTGAAIIGVDFALFWGFLAFVLNYVPNIGSMLAAVPAILVALLQLGVGAAAALAGIFLTVNITLGSILDPIIVGRRLGLSTLAILFSLVFWGWTWGLIGLFLALPITATAKIVMEASTSLHPIAILLGPVPRPAREPQLGDTVEAASAEARG
jgi:AI-2 transport protein TqsA